MTVELRNIAIIAHVDHGKTTLIDSIMKQTGMFRDNQQVDERLMDSGDLEKERGITILAKPTSIMWKDVRINIIDTPGHADFGGEVERVLQMADGVILLTDAAEGPMPQTKFVLGKALALGLKPIVIINKIDRPDGRPTEVVDEVFDLFVALDANDQQLDFPILYAAGRDGWCVKELEDERVNLHPLLDVVLEHVEQPQVDHDKPFAMLATLLDSDPYLGRCLIGRVAQGSAKVNDSVKAINLDGKSIETGRLTKLLTFKGTERVIVDEVQAGDIICIAGLTKTSVADTICEPSVTEPLASTPIDPPTMSVTITVNDSPFGGREGKKVTSTVIRERLLAEAETNVAITFAENDQKDAFEIGGRGELQIGVLIETMRREGFELIVSRPRVLYKTDDKGNRLEPIEEVIIDVDEEYVSAVVDGMNQRKGSMLDMRAAGAGKTRIIFHAPSRGLIGYQNRFLTETRGTGVMNRLFHAYDAYKGDVSGRKSGALISTDTGTAVAYAIFNLQDRGTMFISHQTPVYQGMIVGEHTRDNDLEINVLKGKQLTNVRASGTDEAVKLVTPRVMSLEQMMAYINEDELLEVTPQSLRLRKKYLDPVERKRHRKSF
ncbi:translational GTPase TypA [Pelagibacterales bacterium]|jgi:GTP-binding protein|nr:translational GTPase TypA [Pelagibacterales bacterium]MDA9591463.1 translational GTPase TypA [Pelagibacteraceae bacterium]MDA9137346.1 translational GTPase TypA [Pelagibacterales bacterium]MDA9980879.1 translational GTPase TypA [Pelagibacterales bacterium]MDB4220317.1 translational GTPase TypA [Pelagibacterales bacterium]|tara:strand:+ start:78 stop:1895 length:1818 start_codon:yes stop_codon:yes gene_type:complete